MKKQKMRVSSFFKLGQFIYRFRIGVICFWLLILAGCIPFISNLMTPFHSSGFIDETSPSAITDRYLAKELGYDFNRFVILYQSKNLEATNPRYIEKLKNSLAELSDFPIKHEIVYPDANKKQIAKDKHTAYVVILFDNHPEMTHDLLMDLKEKIKTPEGMTMHLGGEPIFIESINKQTQKDLYKADAIAAPVSIIVLILVFGSLIAAFIPMCLGGGCALIMLTSLYFIGHFFSLSIFTLNIALLLGLCLSLDYALFIIYRFREELINNQNKSIENVIAKTLATAGKAVFFSGLAVFISISALLLFPINILFSVGIGGLTAVSIAVLIATTLLPAILAVIKTGINRLSIWKQNKKQIKQPTLVNKSFWKQLATTIVKRPWTFFLTTLVLLLGLGSPFLHVKFGISDFNILPVHSESRQFFSEFEKNYDVNQLYPIMLVITSNDPILSKQNLAKLYKFTRKLQKNPSIDEVNSIVTTNDDITPKQYHTLYHLPKHLMDANVKQLLKTTTREHMTVINVISKYGANTQETKELIQELRQMNPGPSLSMELTGTPVNNVDVLHSIANIFPYAIGWIILLTYLTLLILLRSVFLPFKAIIMNVLSLCASYGVLVFIFQEGYLHDFLNFQPQGMLDISLLIIIFCALFGFSMDYEVFLLTRIHESYITTQDNDKSIIFGIVKSSRIITSAAIIVIFICGSFMVADVLMVKEFGLGIAVAIFVDSFIIRTILVPSTMALVKQWNWYLPKWLDKILP